MDENDYIDFSDSGSDVQCDTPAARKTRDNAAEGTSGTTRTKESHYTTEEAREAALRKELENVRNVNRVIEGVVESLEKAKNNMDNVSESVHNASTLLQTWTRLLSQTEHNQRLILNPQWHGATKDAEDMENEKIQKQHAAERRAAEEQAKREAAARKAEEERRKAEAAPRGRARGRPGAKPRIPSASGPSYTSVGGQGGRGLNRSGSTRGRAGSGIGRGLRGRGTGGLG